VEEGPAHAVLYGILMIFQKQGDNRLIKFFLYILYKKRWTEATSNPPNQLLIFNCPPAADPG